MSKNNSVMCVYCPIARNFLSEYSKYNNLYNNRKTTKIKKEKLKQEIKNSISKLANLLSLDFNTMNNFLLNKSVPEMTVTSTNLPKLCCLTHIASIIEDLEGLFSKEEDDIDNLCLFTSRSIKIMIAFEDFLKKNNIKTEIDPLTEDEKFWSHKFINSMGIVKCNGRDYYISKNNKSKKENEKAQDTYYKFVDLFECYINNSIGKVKYECCNKAYKDFQILKNVTVNKYKNCHDELFIKQESTKQEIVRNKINNILNYETTIPSKIVCNYLKKANKHPMYIIDCLMNLQRITDTDIAILLFGNSKEKSNVRKWHKPYISTEELPKQAKLHLKELAKIFLVSEDVLSCGTGKIYGNWKIALDENKNINFQKQLLTSEDKKELREIEIPQHRRPASKTREQIYERIRNFINQTDDNFKIMISENPKFFYEEDICLFTYEEDGEEYYDLELMYESLLHPEDFDTLLSVLEELQAKGNN